MRWRNNEGKDHKLGKKILAGWLRDAAKKEQWQLTRAAKVYYEWPLVRNEPTALHEKPSFRALRRAGKDVAAVLDICVVDASGIYAGFEVCSWHPVPAHKALFFETLPFPVIEIDVNWIFMQRERPMEWQTMFVWGPE